MSKANDDRLEGLKVLVTRPQHQQNPFVEMLESAGAQAISLPTIEIAPLATRATEKLAQLASSSGSPTLLIFTSINAVNYANQAYPMPWQSTHSALAIGKATAHRLEALGMPVAYPPRSPYNSEACLELIEENWENLQNVAIIKGEGGRTLLQDSLREQRKTVEFIDVYRRILPHTGEETVNSVFLNSEPDIVSITSNESLRNLVLLAGDRFAEPLKLLPLAVNSERCARLAKALGFKSRVLIAQTPGDQGQFEAINLWNRSYRF